MPPFVTIPPSPDHAVAYKDITDLVGKHAAKLTPVEILAIASNVVGKLIALQDQRTMSKERAFAIVLANIEKGNEQAIAELLKTQGERVMPLIGKYAELYARKQYTCVKCTRTHEASTGDTFAALCPCGNEIAVLADETGVVYVRAETAEFAEKSATRVPLKASKRGDNSAHDEYERWCMMPLPIRQRNALYSVRRMVLVDT